jgi:hypothetical protein
MMRFMASTFDDQGHPFNKLTKTFVIEFVIDMKLGASIPVTLSPSGYKQGRSLCREIAERLRLPSAVTLVEWFGHTWGK